ncbi:MULTISPECIES: 5-formyltetrahydrofolate cyclo-ligase [unclassified Actinobaculum]|uniref:5-formyltetrahydrofolate cyclo-ligase n=1 Tax=unclassified Actinobaculum TaxID=2609299 RepID=UPI000D529D07|nr:MULTISPECIES: 5-formyltetrahydrofolate cyclo-ligase [unclassified Actinobaculum]AWE43368.1 5-formyltetrahydrofolate cyclo-ligase [Actinobaculum sp. 313]RTE49305.1 5-formyltetrahydrofolate cyclo-ligase [Actinobaculum sp. 352]
MRMDRVTLPDVSGMDVEDAKQVLRATAREHRSRRPANIRGELGNQWVATAMDFIDDAQIIAVYASVNNEPPTLELCEALIVAGRRVLLPKLGPGLAREWGWYRGADDLAVLAPGRPPEPSGDAIGSEILAEVDVMLVPAMLVDHHGNRIGQGGGWYDRVLKQIRPETRVGAMVYPEEYVDIDLPQCDTDQQVSYVLLPDRWGACGATEPVAVL